MIIHVTHIEWHDDSLAIQPIWIGGDFTPLSLIPSSEPAAPDEKHKKAIASRRTPPKPQPLPPSNYSLKKSRHRGEFTATKDGVGAVQTAALLGVAVEEIPNFLRESLPILMTPGRPEKGCTVTFF